MWYSNLTMHVRDESHEFTAIFYDCWDLFKIKKCGIRFVLEKDLEQFANSDDNEYFEASGNGLVPSQDDEGKKTMIDDESHPTSNSNKIFTLVCCLISRLKISKNQSNWFYFQFTMLLYKVF